MSSDTTVKCTTEYNGCDPAQCCIKADADIAGIGAIIAFCIASGTCLLLSIILFVLDLDDHMKDRWPDVYARKVKERILGRRPSGETPATQLFRALIFPVLFSLSDTQLLTGIAIMVGGWSLFSGDLSTYHFTIISDLAWLASNTQLPSYFVLRRYIRDDIAKGQPLDGTSSSTPQPISSRKIPSLPGITTLPSRLTRAFLMVVQFAMMLAISRIASHREWGNSFYCPVHCLAEFHPGGEYRRWMIVNILFLVTGYGSALIPMFAPTYRGFSWLTGASTLDDPPAKSPLRRLILIVLHFLDSMVFDILFTSSWFILGIRDVVLDRRSGSTGFCNPNDSEDEWGFGQVVPVILFMTSVVAFMDALGSFPREEKATGVAGEKPSVRVQTWP